MIFPFIGALGLVFIIGGVIFTKPRVSNLFFIVGGVLLLVYSVYIRDVVFIVLEAVFVVVAATKLFLSYR